MDKIRLTTVIAVLIVTLCILLGGRYLYESYYVKNSLHKEISQAVQAEEIRIAKQEDPPAVYIHVPEIKNLQSTYLCVEKIVRQQLGPGYKVILTDKRTSKLENLYEKCSFIIQEAIATGNFLEMEQKIDDLSKTAGVKHHLSIDSKNIYLELRDNRGYLYEVIPRSPQLGQQKNMEKLGGEGF